MLCGRRSALRRVLTVLNLSSVHVRVRSHVFDRVNVTLHENLGCTPLACSTARNAQKSLARDTGVHDAKQCEIRSGRNSGSH